MALHPLKKNMFVLNSQIATVQQTQAIAIAILDAMLGFKEDENIPAGLRQVGRSAIISIRTSVNVGFDAITAKLKELQFRCDANLQ